jgi:hypothetical protein
VMEVPLWLRNETAEAREITLAADLPAGWTVQSGTGTFVLAAQQVAAARVEIKLPMLGETENKKPEPQLVTIGAESKGNKVGTVKLRVALRKRALPE